MSFRKFGLLKNLFVLFDKAGIKGCRHPTKHKQNKKLNLIQACAVSPGC